MNGKKIISKHVPLDLNLEQGEFGGRDQHDNHLVWLNWTEPAYAKGQNLIQQQRGAGKVVLEEILYPSLKRKFQNLPPRIPLTHRIQARSDFL